MTWATSAGERFLIGAEARLFRAALKEALEALETNDLDCSDTLLEVETKKARLHLFAFVAQFLLRPTSEIGPLNAWTEGAVGIIFASLASSLNYELNTELKKHPAATYWRDRILEAAEERGWKGASEIKSHGWPIECQQSESTVWRDSIEYLQNQILWNREWAVDPFGPFAGDFGEAQESYFHWQHKSTLDTHTSIKLLGDLCGYRRGDFEGEEVI